MSIGDRIKRARESAGLTQQQLGEAVSAGGGRQQVYNWEAGLRTPRLVTLARIAEITGVSAAWITYGPDDAPRKP